MNLFTFLLGVGAAYYLLKRQPQAAVQRTQAMLPRAPQGPATMTSPEVTQGGEVLDTIAARVEGSADKYLAPAMPFINQANAFLDNLRANVAAQGRTPTGMSPADRVNLGAFLGG